MDCGPFASDNGRDMSRPYIIPPRPANGHAAACPYTKTGDSGYVDSGTTAMGCGPIMSYYGRDMSRPYKHTSSLPAGRPFSNNPYGDRRAQGVWIRSTLPVVRMNLPQGRFEKRPPP